MLDNVGGGGREEGTIPVCNFNICSFLDLPPSSTPLLVEVTGNNIAIRRVTNVPASEKNTWARNQEHFYI